MASSSLLRELLGVGLGCHETLIEDGRRGDSVGAIRNLRMGDVRIRQRPLEHSDVKRSYTYEFCPPYRFPTLHNYQAALQVTPVADGNRAFVEWWATFDCPQDEREHWTAYFVESFGKWLESLRAHINSEPGTAE